MSSYKKGKGMSNKYESKENQRDRKDCEKRDQKSKRGKGTRQKRDIREGDERIINDRNDNNSVGISSNNDFSWYNTIPEITRNAARFPFSRPLGTHLSYGSANSEGSVLVDKANGTVTGTQKVIPGIMAIHWTPTIGISTSPLSAVNVTSREIYSFVRHANSGAANYDATDLTLYLLAMDSIYSMYTAGVRAYGLMMMYTKENRYMPSYLIKALGFDYDALRGNLAQFRWALNQIAYKISSFAVPNFMSYYLRHMWMNSGVYTDKPSAKAQMYVFVQDDVFVYDNNIHSGTFAGLKSVNISNELAFNVDSWLDFMNTMIDPMLASEDMGIMSGDVLKAFGTNNLFTVAPIPDDFVLVPSYSPEVLSQIQNLSVVGRVANDVFGTANVGSRSGFYTSSIVQSLDGETLQGYLYYNPLFLSAESHDPSFVDNESAVGVTTIDKLITSDADTPDESFVMVSTRLTNTPSHVGYATISGYDNEVFMAFDEDHLCSTEVVVQVDMISVDDTVNVGTYGLYVDLREDRNINQLAGQIAILSKFDWNPTFAILEANDVSGFKFKGYYQDTNNYTLMSADDLNRLHEAAILSEFYVPQISSATRKPISK